MAAEFLWAHAPKIDPTFREAGGDGGGGGSWGFDDGANTGGGGFASSWGFAADPAKQDDNPFANSWGFSAATSLPSAPQVETLEDFKQRVREEAQRSARSVKDVIDELNGEDFPSLDELIAGVGVGRKRAVEDAGEEESAKRARVGKGVDGEDEVDEYAMEVKAEEEAGKAGGAEGAEGEELDEEEVERMARELMERSEAEAARALEEEDREEREGKAGKEKEEEKAEEKLTLGRLMRVVGVEPGMFGWDDDLEDFL